MKRAAAARVLPMHVPTPPPDRGPMVDARQIQAMIGGDKPPSVKHITRRFPHRIQVGYRTIRWYLSDVRSHLESLRNGGGE